MVLKKGRLPFFPFSLLPFDPSSLHHHNNQTNNPWKNKEKCGKISKLG